MIKISRRSDIDPFMAMDVMRDARARAAAGEDIVHMEIGEPCFVTPQPVIEAAKQAMEAGFTGYTLALGHTPLRQRLAEHYADSYGLEIDQDRIIITMGSSAGFQLAFLSLFDVGDRVAIAEPGYAAYPKIMKALGLEAVPIPAGPESDFVLSTDALEEAQQLSGVLIASPANPTGTMMNAAEVKELADWCAGHDIPLISDEVYHGISFSQRSVSALEVCDDAVILGSFSKYFCMTGWRVGWMIVPPMLGRTIERLAQNLYISPPSISQHAALKAFDCTQELDSNVAAYAHNREFLLSAFPAAGLGKLAPANGAFYIYADISDYADDSFRFCEKMLSATGIAATPGHDFDSTNGGRYVRFSFAGSYEDMEKAASRLKSWLASGN